MANSQPPVPPPPPPMPNESRFTNAKPQIKMRTLNWRRIPERKVLTSLADDVRVDCGNSQTKRYSSISTLDDERIDDKTNVWFLIAKENKSIKTTQPTNTLVSGGGTKSASKVREMLESVRRRMAALTANYDDSSCKVIENDHQKRPKNIMEAIDFEHLENLFRLNSQTQNELASENESPNFVRRSSLRTNASSDSVISSNSYYCQDSSNNGDEDDSDSLFEFDILDSKKSLNVNIFLKQLKSSKELINRVNRDQHSLIGKEKLENLLKLLPDELESARLLKVYKKNRQHKLPVAERFLLQLITEVPSSKLRIKFMLLQEEYYTDLAAIPSELDKIDQATSEIKKSKMFRDVLNLVLVTGNFLNTGGYAADAAGFTLDCLERLGEVKSNKQGVYLIHYVAEVANKLGLIEFQQKELPHVETASRVCLESIKLDLSSMLDKIADLKRETEEEVEKNRTIKDKEDRSFLTNLLSTLEDIKGNTEFLCRRTTHSLEKARVGLANYLCEDPSCFKFHDCFHNILAFSQKLKTASDENEQRRKAESSRLSRSNNCLLRRSNTINPKLMKQGRLSLGNLKTQPTEQPPSFPYSSAGDVARKQTSLDTSIASQSGLSRTVSTFNVCNNSSVQEYDDLHQGLMKLLEDTKSRRASDIHNRPKNHSIDTHRRTSKLFSREPTS